MNVYSFKNVNKTIIDKINTYYQKYKIKYNNNNKTNIYKKKSTTITIFKTNTVLFQGKNCKDEAIIFFDIKKNISNNNNYYSANIIGNDEVGVGDIFGPLVVTSCYINSINIKKLKKIKIIDSKKLKNNQIMLLAPKIKKLIKHKTEIINNNTYNKLYDKYKNSHIIKAIAHNKAINKLLKLKLRYYKAIIIDQFVNEKKYYEYLKNKKNVIKDKIIFTTKAENKYLAVACSSIISRYIFLKEIIKLEKKYNIKLPLGASNKVKHMANQYKLTFKENEYRNFIKKHFNLKI